MLGASESMQFFIEAEDRGERRQSNSVSVSIMVAPDSVSIPKFNQSFCFITISENQAIGAEVKVLIVFLKPSLFYLLLDLCCQRFFKRWNSKIRFGKTLHFH